MVRKRGGVTELDCNCFDCFEAREHGGMIELDLIVMWCESMGSE